MEKQFKTSIQMQTSESFYDWKKLLVILNYDLNIISMHGYCWFCTMKDLHAAMMVIIIEGLLGLQIQLV